MEKPISVIVEELNNNLLQAVNNSGLPPVLSIYIVRNFLSELEIVAKNQTVAEKKQYEQSLKEDLNDGNSETTIIS